MDPVRRLGPQLVEFVSLRIQSGQPRPDSLRIKPNLGRLWSGLPKLARIRPICGQCRPSSSRLRSSRARVRPMPGRFEPTLVRFQHPAKVEHRNGADRGNLERFGWPDIDQFETIRQICFGGTAMFCLERLSTNPGSGLVVSNSSDRSSSPPPESDSQSRTQLRM